MQLLRGAANLSLLRAKRRRLRKTTLAEGRCNRRAADPPDGSPGDPPTSGRWGGSSDPTDGDAADDPAPRGHGGCRHGRMTKLERDEEEGAGVFRRGGRRTASALHLPPCPSTKPRRRTSRRAGSGEGEGEGDKTASADDTEMPSPRYSKSRQFIMDGIGRGGLVRHHSSDERKATLLEAFGDWHRPVGGPSWRS